MTRHRACSRICGMSARQARHLLGPMLSQVDRLDSGTRVAFRPVESSRGAFVFGTLLSWEPGDDAPAAGIHVGTDDEETADRVLAPFLEMVVDRLTDGVLVHDGLPSLLAFLARHRAVPEAKALVEHVEKSLDFAELLRVLMPAQAGSLVTMAEQLAGVPPTVTGMRLTRRASAIDAPAALVRMAKAYGPREAWERMLLRHPTEWADEWIHDDSPVWESLLTEDGALQLTRLREVDRWLMDEVLTPTSEWVC